MMHEIAFLIPIAMFALIALIPIGIIALILWFILSLVNGGRKDSAVTNHEHQIVQEIHAGLEKMEKRVETLETILLDRAKKQ
ncbi:MAG: envelope stress response membrane protein PspB [Candidatus Sumerlaeia bacterium]